MKRITIEDEEHIIIIRFISRGKIADVIIDKRVVWSR